MVGWHSQEARPAWLVAWHDLRGNGLRRVASLGLPRIQVALGDAKEIMWVRGIAVGWGEARTPTQHPRNHDALCITAERVFQAQLISSH